MAYIPFSSSSVATVTASGTITTQNLVPAGTATAASAVEITLNGLANLAIQVTGTYTGALSLQVTVNGTAWITVGGVPLLNVNTGGNLATITSALQSVFQADVSGMVKARITGLAAMTGTATVTLIANQSASLIAIDAPLPTGANVIGGVSLSGNASTIMSASATTAPAKLEDAVHSSGDNGIFVLGVRADTLAAGTSASGDYSAFLTDAVGRAYVNNQTAVNVGRGVSIFKTYALTNVAQTVKAAAGNVYGYNIINLNTLPIYIKIYNVLIGGITVATTVPDRTFVVPAIDSAGNPGSVMLADDDSSFFFGSAAISILATSTLASPATQVAPTISLYAEVIYST